MTTQYTHGTAAGLLHDIDFELYPEEHCQKAVELLEFPADPLSHEKEAIPCHKLPNARSPHL